MLRLKPQFSPLGLGSTHTRATPNVFGYDRPSACHRGKTGDHRECERHADQQRKSNAQKRALLA
jgi:hypothetical protein